MKINPKKRLLLTVATLATVGAVATLVSGVTFGLFSSSPQTEDNTFTSGTVSLSSDATGICAVTAAIPGDSGTCTFVVTYTGTASAFIGLDVTESHTGTALYDGTAAGIQYSITRNGSANTFAVGTTNRYLATDTSGASARTITVAWNIPLATGNAYQGGDSTLTLTAHAVQSANNGSCSTVGSACSGVTWS